MAQRFLDEALKRRDEVDLGEVASYMRTLLNRLNSETDSDEALMYSTLIQNYTQHRSL